LIALILQQMLGYNVEALAQDEGYNKGDRLKSVSCTCPNNKSGFSLKCRADGNLELLPDKAQMLVIKSNLAPSHWI